MTRQTRQTRRSTTRRSLTIDTHDRHIQTVDRQTDSGQTMTGQTRGRQSHVTVTHHTHVICSCLDRVITHRHINDIRINNIETTSTSTTVTRWHGHDHDHVLALGTPTHGDPTHGDPTHGHPLHMTPPMSRRGGGCHIIPLHHRGALGEAHLGKGGLPPPPKGCLLYTS